MTTAPTAFTSSGTVTALDTVPKYVRTAGEGAEGDIVRQTDYIHVTTGMLAVSQAWRLCRIPTSAKIKSVKILSDAIMDSNSSQLLALEVSLAFSDSTIDGTNSALQGQIPTSANNGAVTPVATYTSPNLMFGTITHTGNDVGCVADATTVAGSGVVVREPLDITFNGGSLLYNSLPLTETPLWQLFGFTSAQGLPQDPGGFFDLLFMTKAAAATAVAANFQAVVDFVK